MQKVDAEDFFDRMWAKFKAGFGDVGGNYWLGNDQIHQLTKDDGYKLRVDFHAESYDQQRYWYWAEYGTFIVADESNNYRLTIGGYTGDAGDIFYDIDDMMFSTKDNDHDGSVYNVAADEKHFGFWHDYNGTECELMGRNEQFYCTHIHMSLITSRMWLQCK